MMRHVLLCKALDQTLQTSCAIPASSQMVNAIISSFHQQLNTTALWRANEVNFIFFFFFLFYFFCVGVCWVVSPPRDWLQIAVTELLIEADKLAHGFIFPKATHVTQYLLQHILQRKCLYQGLKMSCQIALDRYDDKQYNIL